MGTLPISPTIYQVNPGREYNELIATPTWSNPDAMSKDYTEFFSYQVQSKTYVVGYVYQNQQTDTYVFEGASQGLAKQQSTSLEGAYNNLSVATFNNNQYLMGYEPSSGHFDFYLIGNDLSYTKVYTFDGPQNYTTASLFTYRGALYFMGYEMQNGAVAYYQVTTEGDSLTAAQIWSDTWAQGWTRFTFFQMAMENFFFKTNTQYNNVNIDHIMDDPADGSHPVGTHLPLSQDLTDVEAFYFAGDAYFATYQDKTGEATINRFLANGQGWVENTKYKTFTNGRLVVPFYNGDDTFLLFY